MSHERTSERIASLAARGLADPSSLSEEEQRAVYASALTQAPDRVGEDEGDVSEPYPKREEE